MKDTKVLQFVDTTLSNQFIKDEAKAEIASLLEQAGIEVIQIPSKEASFTSQVISSIKNSTVAVACIPMQEPIDEAWEVVENAQNPRIRLMLNSEIYSRVNLSNKQDKDDIAKLLKDSIAYCKKHTENIEVIIGLVKDLHKVFVYKLIEVAAEAGVKIITISDFEAPLLPHEFDELYADIVYNLPEYEDLILGVSSANKLGVATANSMAAVRNGARQLDVRPIVTPSCHDNAVLKRVIAILKAKKKDLKFKTRVDQEALKALNRKVKENISF